MTWYGSRPWGSRSRNRCHRRRGRRNQSCFRTREHTRPWPKWPAPRLVSLFFPFFLFGCSVLFCLFAFFFQQEY
jgi:hypothetical protein